MEEKLNNKTCGDCCYLSDAKKIGVCEKMKLCLCPAELPACKNFAEKKPTNGDVIRQMSSEELAKYLFEAPPNPPNCDEMPDEKCISCCQCWIAWLNAPADCVGKDINVRTKESEVEDE